MQTYKYSYQFKNTIPEGNTIKVGVAGSGNLQIIVRPSTDPSKTEFSVSTVIEGFENTWKAVIERFTNDFPYGGLSYTLQDAGATPPVVSLRLRQAFETYQSGYHIGSNFLEMNARERIYSLVDDNSFREFLLNDDCNSPNLLSLKMQTEDDDGVVIGTAKFAGKDIAIAAQQKDFIGGSVGEVHGAKINGLVKYAVKKKLEAIVFCIDSGGVRLQEANVGEIEISEIIRSVLEAKSAGIKAIGVVCGSNGAFGGMGILCGVLDVLIVNQVARIGISGAEVIQAVKGIEMFNASDHPLVWRVYGGRTRFIQGAARYYTSNTIGDIKKTIETAIRELDDKNLISFEKISEEQKNLQSRIASAKNCTEEGEWLQQYPSSGFKGDLFDMENDEFLESVKKLNMKI